MTQQPPQGPKWSPDEDALLIQYYRAYGARDVRRRMRLKSRNIPSIRERSVSSIWHRARRLGLEYDPTKGGKLVLLSDAHPDNVGRPGAQAKAHRAILEAAQRDGVLVREVAYPRRAMAPSGWVDSYMERLAESFDDAEASEGEWLTTREVSALFGLSERSFASVATPSYNRPYAIHAHLARIPQRYLRVRTPKRTFNGKFWRSEEARREARLYQMRRARKRMRKQAA